MADPSISNTDTDKGEGNIHSSPPINQTEAVEWLQYYGYLPEGDDAPPSQEDVTTALRAAQSFSGIPVTGIYDEATRNMMAQERCGNTDLDHPVTSHVGGPRKFVLLPNLVRGKYALTYGFHDYSAHFTQQQCRDCVRDALYKFSAIAPFTFTEADGNGPVDILYRWGAGLDHLGCPSPFRPGTNAHSWNPSTPFSQAYWQDAIPAGQIHFADDHAAKWTLERMSAIALHETGHALGLDHSYIQGSVMCSSLNTDLSLDDISGLQSLYADQNPLKPTLLGAGQELYMLLPNNGLVYQRMAHPANAWTIIDDNWKNRQIVTKAGKLYLHHKADGRVYEFGGQSGQWTCLYRDVTEIMPSLTTRMIAASGKALYVLMNDDHSVIFQWQGSPFQWTGLDADPILNAASPGGGVAQICAAGFDPTSRFFALMKNGTVLQVKTGDPGTVAPGGRLPITVTTLYTPDPNTIAADGIPMQLAFAAAAHTEGGKKFVIYILLSKGKILQLLDVDDPQGTKLKPGETNWRVVDDDPKNSDIACAGEFLFFWRESDRTLWEYLGQRNANPYAAKAGPLVRKVDDDVANLSVAGLDWTEGNGRRVVVVKSWGRIWERLT